MVDPYTNEVSFVDLDSVIIMYSGINPYSTPGNPRKAAEWNAIHRSEVIPCDNCFAYSEIDLESHYNSDHNVYAVCSVCVFMLC